MTLSKDDIVAIKNIRGGTGNVYLGALQPLESMTWSTQLETPPGIGAGPDFDFSRPHNPGVWTRIEDRNLPTPASSRDGRVGDLLAVASTRRCGLLDELHGKLVALIQHRKVTHLGVVRSASNLSAHAPNRHSAGDRWFEHFIWLEVIAMHPDGFSLPVKYDTNGFPFNRPGGSYARISEYNFERNGGTADELRKAIWEGFETIHLPTFDFSCTRGAIRP